MYESPDAQFNSVAASESLPSGWIYRRLDELAADCEYAIVDGPFGSNLKVADYVDQGVPVLQGSNITGDALNLNDLRFVTPAKAHELRRSLAKCGDLIVVKIGSVGYSAVINNLGPYESALIPANLLKATLDAEQVLTKYAYWYLTSEHGRRKLLDSASQTAQPALTLTRFKALTVPIPPFPEQRRIADILDTADAAIQQTDALIAKLKLMRAGLLHDLLTRGLDENGQLRDPVAHPEQFKETSLGYLPCEWHLTTLRDIAAFITSGSRGWAAYYADDGPIFLRIGNLTRDHINLRLDDVVHVHPPKGGEGSRTAVQEGDVLISITADLGNIGVIPARFGEAYVNQHIALVRIEPTEANPRWVGTYLTGIAGQKQFYRLNDAGAKAGLNLPTVGNMLVALPPMEEQKAIATIVDTHDARIRAEEAYRDKLKLIKQGLMDDLLTGRVRVPVAEEAVI